MGKKNLDDALSEVSGLPRSEVNAIWAAVKANHRKLDGCPAHKFSPVDPSKAVDRSYRCSACGGEVDAIAFSWFQRGLEQGRREK